MLTYFQEQQITELLDNYEFDLKFEADAYLVGSFWGNVGTMAGAIWNGSGVLYSIIPTGKAKIKW